MSDSKPVILEGTQGQLFMARLVTKALIALAVVFLVGVIYLIARRDSDGLVLAVGSVP